MTEAEFQAEREQWRQLRLSLLKKLCAKLNTALGQLKTAQPQWSDVIPALRLFADQSRLEFRQPADDFAGNNAPPVAESAGDDDGPSIIRIPALPAPAPRRRRRTGTA